MCDGQKDADLAQKKKKIIKARKPNEGESGPSESGVFQQNIQSNQHFDAH